MSKYVNLVVFVPETHAVSVREVMGLAGVGKIGNYSYCSFSVKGVGRFMPNKEANPYVGTVNVLEEIAEERIEAVCLVGILDSVITAIKKVHPYEEPVMIITPCL